MGNEFKCCQDKCVLKAQQMRSILNYSDSASEIYELDRKIAGDVNDLRPGFLKKASFLSGTT